MVTIRDVARQAGVSVATVSRVLNNSALVSQDTREAVMKAVAALGYRPNANAQALAKRKPEPFDPERDYLCAAGRLITDSRGMAALLGLLASHGEMGVLSAPSLDLMRAPQDGLGGVGQIGRGLNTAALPGVFPGFSPVGHQGVAYGMCAELFADPTTGAGVGVMTSGTRLNRDTPPLMRVGFDLLTLGFASLRGAD